MLTVKSTRRADEFSWGSRTQTAFAMFGFRSIFATIYRIDWMGLGTGREGLADYRFFGSGE